MMGKLKQVLVYLGELQTVVLQKNSISTRITVKYYNYKISVTYLIVSLFEPLTPAYCVQPAVGIIILKEGANPIEVSC